MTVFAPSLNYFWKSARSFGLDPKAMFKIAGIDPALRKDPTARVSADQMDHLYWLANQQSQDERFVFKLVRHAHPSYLGALGYAWMTSRTLRGCFLRMSRHAQFLQDEIRVEVSESADQLLVTFDSTATAQRDPALRERARVAIAVQLCRMNCGEPFAPSRICLQQPKPANVDDYYEFFRCEIFFDSPKTQLAMPTVVADEELDSFDSQLVTRFDRLIAEYTSQRQQADIVGRTRGAIFRELPSGKATLESIADGLHISSRTLHRKLAEHNQTFRDLLIEVRRELAEKYMRDMSLSLTEVSFLLGFSEMSTFSRAFKNWTGEAPGRYRTQGHA